MIEKIVQNGVQNSSKLLRNQSVIQGTVDKIKKWFLTYYKIQFYAFAIGGATYGFIDGVQEEEPFSPNQSPSEVLSLTMSKMFSGTYSAIPSAFSGVLLALTGFGPIMAGYAFYQSLSVKKIEN